MSADLKFGGPAWLARERVAVTALSMAAADAEYGLEAGSYGAMASAEMATDRFHKSCAEFAVAYAAEVLA